MKQIQKWFELMAGICREELAREERAREIFAGANQDLQSLQKPACWRRKSASVIRRRARSSTLWSRSRRNRSGRRRRWRCRP